jgi:hypothetical protein
VYRPKIDIQQEFDPTLLQNAMPQMLLTHQLGPFPLTTPDPPSNAADAHSSDDSDAQEETARPSGSNRRRRIRVTRKNALHGQVEGAMRGNKVFGMSSAVPRAPRQHPDRP